MELRIESKLTVYNDSVAGLGSDKALEWASQAMAGVVYCLVEHKVRPLANGEAEKTLLMEGEIVDELA